MTFTPYRCVHVPVESAGALGTALTAWPTWLIVTGLALGYWRWGPWLFIVPTACVVCLMTVVTGLRYWTARQAPSGVRPPARARAVARTVGGVTVVISDVPATHVHVCLRCEARLAVTTITVRGRQIPVCDPCLPVALTTIGRAAELEASR